MKRTNLVMMAALAAAGVVGMLTGTLAPTVAVAAEGQKLSSSVMKPLKAVESAMKDQNWEEAMTYIREAQAVEPQTPYDTFIIDERAWYIQYQKKDFAGAATALERSVNSGFLAPEDLPRQAEGADADSTTRSRTIRRQWNSAIATWKRMPDDRDIAKFVAYSYYNEKDYAKARAEVAEAHSREKPTTGRAAAGAGSA